MYRQYTPEERAAYKAQQEAKQEEMLMQLAANWKAKPEDIAEYLRFSARFYQYSPRNTALIYAQNPAAQFCGSYKFYADRGYYVRNGEKGMSIRVYTPVTFYRTHAGAPWKRLSDATPDTRRLVDAGAIESREQAFFKYGYVFDIGQTTCPRGDYPKLMGLGYDSAEHAQIYQTVVGYCAQIGILVSEGSLHAAGLRGTYTAGTHEVRVNDLLGDTQKLSTALHEMAHGILEHSPLGEKSAAQREFEADALAILLSHQFGIEPTDTRKQHLAAVYADFAAELEAAGKIPTADVLFADVRKAAAAHAEKLTAAVDQALGREPIAEQSVPAVQENSQPDGPAEFTWPKRMSVPQEGYRLLLTMFPELMNGQLDHVRLKAPHMEPLSLEWISENELSVMQTYEQNGDLMMDPEITLRVDHTARLVYPLTFRQDGLGLYQEVGNGTQVNLELRRKLNRFFVDWMHNIENTGYIRAAVEKQLPFFMPPPTDLSDVPEEMKQQILENAAALDAREPRVTPKSEHLEVEGHFGTWYVIDDTTVNGQPYFLLEHEKYGDEVPGIVVDAQGKLVMEECWNGLSELRGFLARESAASMGVKLLRQACPDMDAATLEAAGAAVGFEALRHRAAQPKKTMLDPLKALLPSLDAAAKEQLYTRIRTCGAQLEQQGLPVEDFADRPEMLPLCGGDVEPEL